MSVTLYLLDYLVGGTEAPIAPILRKAAVEQLRKTGFKEQKTLKVCSVQPDTACIR
jgi:hypothetical protein